jgi:hypothetical protein
MKKLNLEKLKLAAEDVLQRSQLSTIYGGSVQCIPVSGTCAYKDTSGYTVCNISRATAECYVNKYGGNWCCTNCSNYTC